MGVPFNPSAAFIRRAQGWDVRFRSSHMHLCKVMPEGWDLHTKCSTLYSPVCTPQSVGIVLGFFFFFYKWQAPLKSQIGGGGHPWILFLLSPPHLSCGSKGSEDLRLILLTALCKEVEERRGRKKRGGGGGKAGDLPESLWKHSRLSH